MKKIKFNCVEMKRQGAEALNKKMKNMTKEQEYNFWKEQTQSLKHLKELKQRQIESSHK